MPRALTQEERDRRDAATLERYEARRATIGTPEDRPKRKRGPKSKNEQLLEMLITLVVEKIADGSIALPGKTKRVRHRAPKANPQKRGRKPWWWSEADTPEAQETMMQWV